MKKRLLIVSIIDLFLLILLIMWINSDSERSFYESTIIWSLLFLNFTIGFILLKANHKEMAKVFFINFILSITIFHILFGFYQKNYDTINYEDSCFKFDGLDYDLRVEKRSNQFYCTENVKDKYGNAVSVTGGTYKKQGDTVYFFIDSSEKWTLFKNKLTGFFKHSDTIIVKSID